MQLVGRRPDEGLDVPFIYTRGRPEDQPRPPGRISIGDLASQGWPAELQPTCYVYGPTGFVETVSDLFRIPGPLSQLRKRPTPNGAYV